MVSSLFSYIHSLILISLVFIDDRDPGVYVDFKTCLDTYSWQLIRHRLPPPSEPTIVIELARFIPGSNQPTADAGGPSSSTPTPGPSGSVPHSSSSTPAVVYAANPEIVAAGPPTKRKSATGSRPSTGSSQPPKAKPSIKKETPPEAPSQKRKAEVTPTGENGRRLKLVFREGDQASNPPPPAASSSQS